MDFGRFVRDRRVWMLALALIVVGVAHLVPEVALAAPAILMIGDTAKVDIAHLLSTEVQDTVKEVYLDALDAVPDATPLTAQLEKGAKVQGAAGDLTFNVKLRTGGAVANVSDAGKLPRPTRPVRKKGKAGLAHTYTVIAVGGQSVPLTRKTRNAFVSNLEEQFEDGMERVRFDLERQYNGDGNGILCVIETIAGAPTYGVAQPYGRVYAQAGVPGVQLLIEDMDVAVIDPATGNERDRGKITAVDFDNDEVTLDAALAGAAIGDYLVLCNDNAAAGTDKETNYQAEANGLGAVIGVGDFEDIAGAQHRRWQTVDVDLNNVKVSEKAIATLDARIIARSGQKPDLYYTTRGIVISLQDDLVTRRRDTTQSLELKGGYTGLVVNGRRVLPGDWCPKGDFYALNTQKKNVAMVDVVKMGYVDLDGAKLHRVEGRHAYRADLWMPHNAIWTLRSAQGRIKNCTDDLSILR